MAPWRWWPVLAFSTAVGTAAAQPSQSFPPPPAGGTPAPPPAPPAGQPAPSAPPAGQPAPPPPGTYPAAPGPGYGPPAAPGVVPCPDQAGFSPYRRYPGCGFGDDEFVPVFVEVARPDVHRHDGWYVRLAVGIGFGRDQARTGEFGPFQFDGSGFSAGTQLGLGYSFVPGFVLALSIDTATLPKSSGSVSAGGGGAGVNYDFKVSQLAIYALGFDVYPWPRSGFHVQGGAGLSVYVSPQGDPAGGGGPRIRAHTAVGWGLTAGLGYEWWVGEQWSMGVLARILYGKGNGTDPEGIDWRNKTLFPGLMLAFTYH